MTSEISAPNGIHTLASVAGKKAGSGSHSSAETIPAPDDKSTVNASQSGASVSTNAAENGKRQEDMQSMVTSLNQIVQNQHRSLQFNIDEESGEMVVKVIDSQTEELIRQIPAKEVLQLSRRLSELQNSNDNLSNLLLRDIKA